MNPAPRLVLMPSITAAREAEKVVLTQKFIAGALELQKHWSGPLHVVIEPATGRDDNLDQVAVAPAELPFEISVLSYDSPQVEGILRDAAVVLLAVQYRQLHLAALCERLGVPAVYTSEYSLRTRLQIMRTETRNPVLVVRRALWQLNQERQIRRALARSAGVQCNGTPTWTHYKDLSPNPLLFFDTRIEASMLADDEALARRFATRRKGGPLRLAFSGRLIRMKGADHLVKVAQGLRARGTAFELSICGGGDLEPVIRRDIARLNLGKQVQLKGTLDFAKELVPFIRDHVDVFVCCHRQGDPSCTYLETMSCGVPIVGYDNEALAGVVRQSGAGWSTPLDKPGLLAERISQLTAAEIEDHSRRSLSFARAHTFEGEFQRRMEHLRSLAKGPVRKVA